MRASESGKAGYRFYDGAVTCGRIRRVAKAKKRDESAPVLRKSRDVTRPQPGSVSIDMMRKQDGVTRGLRWSFVYEAES